MISRTWTDPVYSGVKRSDTGSNTHASTHISVLHQSANHRVILHWSPSGHQHDIECEVDAVTAIWQKKWKEQSAMHKLSLSECHHQGMMLPVDVQVTRQSSSSLGPAANVLHPVWKTVWFTRDSTKRSSSKSCMELYCNWTVCFAGNQLLFIHSYAS